MVEGSVAFVFVVAAPSNVHLIEFLSSIKFVVVYLALCQGTVTIGYALVKQYGAVVSFRVMYLFSTPSVSICMFSD